MSPYLIFVVDNGSPEEHTSQLTNSEVEALAHALLLCRNNKIPLDKIIKDLEIEELDVDCFQIGIGYGENTFSGRDEHTVYIWDMDLNVTEDN